MGRKIEIEWSKEMMEAIATHYLHAWMADYDPIEVGEYLEDFGTSHTGHNLFWYEKNDWQSNRGDFLKWKYQKSAGAVQTRPSKRHKGRK